MHARFPPPEMGMEGREEFSVAWLYEEAARLWPSLFEVPKGESSNILRAGFYSVSPLPGLTLLSVNTNFCYYLNW